MAFEIKTEIAINARASRVWDILMNFEDYPDWNPFIQSLQVNPRLGNQIRASIDGVKFNPVLLANEKETEFKWGRKLLFKGSFDDVHRFEIEKIDNNRLLFAQSDCCSRELVTFFKKKLNFDTSNGFESMIQKLREKIECM